MVQMRHFSENNPFEENDFMINFPEHQILALWHAGLSQ